MADGSRREEVAGLRRGGQMAAGPSQPRGDVLAVLGRGRRGRSKGAGTSNSGRGQEANSGHQRRALKSVDEPAVSRGDSH